MKVPRPTRRSFLAAASLGGLGATASSPLASQSAAGTELYLSARDQGLAGDGRTDDGPALQRAVELAIARGLPLHVPPGQYLIRRTIRIALPPSLDALTRYRPGPRVIGAGAGGTVFLNASGGPLFDFDNGESRRASLAATLGSCFQGFTIRGRGDGASGIRIRSVYQLLMSDLHIHAMTGTGIQIVCNDGDADASNMIAIERVRIEQCDGWGIDAAAVDGRNEISFLHLFQVFVQACGRAGSGGGGMRWKGQICTVEDSAFTLNRNFGLLIPSGPGVAQSFTVMNTGFENNAGTHLFCGGITGFRGRGVQFYSSSESGTRAGCVFDGSRQPVRQIEIDGAVVRAGGAPHLAFRLAGTHAEAATCRVRNIVWEDFDKRGQARFEGFLFDVIPQQCRVQVLSGSEAIFGADRAVGSGNRTPIRAGGATSATGEWTEAAITSALPISSEGLAPARVYNVYLWDDRGVRRIELSGEAPVMDRMSGYLVKNRDASRLLVGRVSTDANGSFAL